MIRKGTYILILDLPAMRVSIGALGTCDLEEGTYCYVGSAMNGLDQRIGRHLSKNKKTRWHIDYLTKECREIRAYEASSAVEECELGKIVRENGGSCAVKGFGCSDCGCETHLFLLREGTEEKLISGSRFVPFVNRHIRA